MLIVLNQCFRSFKTNKKNLPGDVVESDDRPLAMTVLSRTLEGTFVSMTVVLRLSI